MDYCIDIPKEILNYDWQDDEYADEWNELHRIQSEIFGLFNRLEYVDKPAKWLYNYLYEIIHNIQQLMSDPNATAITNAYVVFLKSLLNSKYVLEEYV